MAIVQQTKLGDTFTGSYGSATRKFRAYIKNVDVSVDGAGTATVTIGMIGLRKVSSGSVEVLADHGDPRVWATFGGGDEKKYTLPSNSHLLDYGNATDIDIDIRTNWSWTIAQTSTAQNKTISFHYKKDAGSYGYAWAGQSNGTLVVEIPAYDAPAQGSAVLNNLLAVRGSYNNIITTFSVTGDYTYVSSNVAITYNGYTYNYTPTKSGTAFTHTTPFAIGDDDSATVSVTVYVIPTGSSTTTPLSQSTFVSPAGTSVAVDFYSPAPKRYNVGIGCLAHDSAFGSENRIDIGNNTASVFIKGVEYTGGGGGEPAAYIKSIGTSGNTLSYTDQDNNTSSYTPSVTCDAAFKVTNCAVDFGTVAAGGYVSTANYDFTTTDDYYPLALAGQSSASKAISSTFFINSASTNSVQIRANCYNLGSSSVSNLTITYRVLWVKQ